MANSFGIKTLRIAIQLGAGSFANDFNTKIIEGLACQVNISKPGLPEKNSASISIWGLKYEDMDQLTMLSFKPLELQKNRIEIQAGNLGETLSLAFQGEITGAWADFNSAPDPVMKFEASSGQFAQLIPSAPLTTNGEAQAEKLFAQFAAEAGFSYKNEGVSSSVNNAWFSGSPLEKAQKLARDVGCELIIDDGVMLTLPQGQARQGNAVLLGPESGLIGYPTFNQDGIICKCLYNPDLTYGSLVKVESIVPKASGAWQITKLTHNLTAYKPDGGPWETSLEAAYYA